MDPTTASWLRKGGGRWGLKYYANFWNSLNRSIHGMMNMIQYEFCTKLLNFSLIHGIGGGIQASEALQIKIQASCPHNCQVGELYWCFFYIILFCVDFWSFYVISIILYYLRTEVDIAEINWINKKSITSIGVSCDHCKEVQKLTRNIGSEFLHFWNKPIQICIDIAELSLIVGCILIVSAFDICRKCRYWGHPLNIQPGHLKQLLPSIKSLKMSPLNIYRK